MIPVFVIVTVLFRKSIRTGYRGVRKANARINTSLQESITGIREIFQFNYKKRSLEHFEKANQYYLVSFLKIIHAYALYFPVIEVVSNISMIIIFLFAHRALGVSVNLGEIFAFFAYINMFFRPLRQLAERFNMFQAAMAAAERIFKLIDQPVVVKNLENPISITKKLKGKISFRNVNFRYRKNNLVLKDLSFDIKPGEKVAIVGHTGSGKTTIINLLNRFYNIHSGDILVDDISINKYSVCDLRSQIATIPQDPFFFTGTVAENISMYDPKISLDRIIAVSKQVFADKFIEKLPNKYQENILEEGKRLSIGERQLLSFARGLLRNPSIFILDEATSNIDSATENLIEAAIDNLLKDRTGIIIAHRLSTIRKVDRILVLNKGRCVEEGNHKQLLKRDGVYSRLYKAQAFSAI
jgi:ABC-type multidrug transport system fused ATPase/permease subunit